jgi:hypothetical protein
VEQFIRRMSLIHQMRLTSHMQGMDAMLSVLSSNPNDFVRVSGASESHTHSQTLDLE